MASLPGRLALLSGLYFAQGLPYGFQSKALPLFLKELGVSNTQVSLSGVLAAPWLLKALWAPLVDRYSLPGWGRRKSWILPAQAVLVLAGVAAAFLPLSTSLQAFLVCILVMNLAAATQDIAADALAVTLLSPRELGLGNSVQVVGYKVGMVVSGGVLIGLVATLGQAGLFLILAGLCAAVALAVVVFPEPASAPTAGGADEGLPFAVIRERLVAWARQPGAAGLLAAVLTYKTGETLADSMFGPFLMEVHALPKETVGLWLGAYAMVGSILGSLAGGLLATRYSLVRAVVLAAVFRAVPVGLMAALVLGWLPVGEGVVVAVATVEHFFAGLLTTAMFALMMSRVDRSIGATHYTVLASLEVLGKVPAGLVSGALVDALGFGPVFALAAVLTFAFLLVTPFLRSSPESVMAE